MYYTYSSTRARVWCKSICHDLYSISIQQELWINIQYKKNIEPRSAFSIRVVRRQSMTARYFFAFIIVRLNTDMSRRPRSILQIDTRKFFLKSILRVLVSYMKIIKARQLFSSVLNITAGLLLFFHFFQSKDVFFYLLVVKKKRIPFESDCSFFVFFYFIISTLHYQILKDFCDVITWNQ